MMTLLLTIAALPAFALIIVWLFGESWQPLRRSTWLLLREGGVRGLFNEDFFHAYVSSRWSNQNIGRAIGHYFDERKGPPLDVRMLA